MARYDELDVILMGKRLRHARMLREMTCERLARAVGVDKSTISRYELGFVGRVRPVVVMAMADALRVSRSWVYCVPGAVATECPEECRWLGFLELVNGTR